MTSDEHFLRKLPKSFNRQYAIRMMIDRGYSIQHTDNLLATLIHKSEIIRVGRGKYRKS